MTNAVKESPPAAGRFLFIFASLRHSRRHGGGRCGQHRRPRRWGVPAVPPLPSDASCHARGLGADETFGITTSSEPAKAEYLRGGRRYTGYERRSMRMASLRSTFAVRIGAAFLALL